MRQKVVQRDVDVEVEQQHAAAHHEARRAGRRTPAPRAGSAGRAARRGAGAGPSSIALDPPRRVSARGHRSAAEACGAPAGARRGARWRRRPPRAAGARRRTACARRRARAARRRPGPAAAARPAPSAPSRRSSPAARRQSSQAEVGGRGRLGQDLGVVDVVAAAEGQAAGGEHELRGAAVLGGQGGDAHRAAPGRRAAARATPAASAARRRAPRRRPRCAATSRAARAGPSPTAGCQRTSAKRRSTRSAARYVHGDARSKKKLTRGRAGGACASARAARRSASEMSSPMSFRTPEARSVMGCNAGGRRTLRLFDDPKFGRTYVENWTIRVCTGSGTWSIVDVRREAHARSPPTRRPPIATTPPPKRHPYNQWAPDARALDLVGDKWTLLIVRDLAGGPRRFVELQRVLPGHLHRAAALPAEPDGGRRAAHAPALPRGPAARGLRADRARPRPAARRRRPRPLGLPLGLGPAAPGRGDRRRRHPALRAGPRRAARAARHGRAADRRRAGLGRARPARRGLERRPTRSAARPRPTPASRGPSARGWRPSGSTPRAPSSRSRATPPSPSACSTSSPPSPCARPRSPERPASALRAPGGASRCGTSPRRCRARA